MRVMIWLWLWILMTGAVVASEPGVTRVPQIYLMHYSHDAPTNRAFVESLRNAPPDILHLGHAVPLNSIFGPTADYSGWKPELKGPAEILRRKGELTTFVKNLHEVGVRNVICYINPSILGGDDQKRLGFWAFYDHWEEYETLGIGPKPERPPEAWMQRSRRSFAPWEPEPNYPLWRYQPCPNEPAWMAYQSAVVRLIAECGYDGVFVDDCVMECRHDLCVERFSEFLKNRHTQPELEEVFGGDLTIGRSNANGARESSGALRNAETRLFWQNSVAGLLNHFNSVGRAVNREFFTLPNWGASARVSGAAARARSGKGSAVWRGASERQLFEEDHPSGSIGTNDWIGYLLQFNYGLELGVRPAILSYGTTRRHIEQGYAEAAAGGGGAYVETSAAYPEIRRKWRAFYEAHSEVFDGFSLVGPVGLVFAFDQALYGNDKHLRDVFAAARALYRMHIPFATVPLENLTLDGLARHKVVIVSEVRFLSDSQLALLNAYVQKGGRLLVAGASGASDELTLPRKGSPFPSLRLAKNDDLPPRVPSDVGLVVGFHSLNEIVPMHEYSVVDALDLRTPETFVARVRELGAASTDSGAYETLNRWLSALAGQELGLSKDESAVCTVAYERFEEMEGVITVHAVRYATPTWGGDDSVAPLLPLKLEVPLPAGWRLTGASVLSPDKALSALEARVLSQKAHCELPPFEFYSLLCLNIGRSGSATTRPAEQ